MFLRSVMKYCLILVCLSLSANVFADVTALTRLTPNDPIPVYSSRNGYDFLNRCYENDIIDYCEPCDNRFFQISFSAFRQTASQGTDIEENENVNLGDLRGNWNVVGLFYDPVAREKLIRGLDLDASSTVTISICDSPLGVNFITDPSGADPHQQFGHFDVSMKYRKYGVRLDSEVALPLNFTIGIKGGVSHIWQEPSFIDLTCQASGLFCPSNDCVFRASTIFNCPFTERQCPVGVASCLCKTFVIEKIMRKKEAIEDILDLHLDENLFISSPYDKTGFEDIECVLNWNRMFAVNKDRCDWPFFVITPFVTLGFTIPTSGVVDPRNPFAISLGNNGHFSYGGRAGLNIDFIQTVAIGGEVGFTGFTSKNYENMPIPTNELQAGIFPAQKTLNVHPGLNWHAAFMISSYRFLDRLSSWVQYEVVHHDKNCYKELCVLPGDDLFKVGLRKLRDESQFRFHVINGALQYEISPHVQLGFVWQIPIFQQNAYRSTTFLASVEIFY